MKSVQSDDLDNHSRLALVLLLNILIAGIGNLLLISRKPGNLICMLFAIFAWTTGDFRIVLAWYLLMGVKAYLDIYFADPMLKKRRMAKTNRLEPSTNLLKQDSEQNSAEVLNSNSRNSDFRNSDSAGEAAVPKSNSSEYEVSVLKSDISQVLNTQALDVADSKAEGSRSLSDLDPYESYFQVNLPVAHVCNAEKLKQMHGQETEPQERNSQLQNPHLDFGSKMGGETVPSLLSEQLISQQNPLGVGGSSSIDSAQEKELELVFDLYSEENEDFNSSTMAAGRSELFRQFDSERTVDSLEAEQPAKAFADARNKDSNIEDRENSNSEDSSENLRTDSKLKQIKTASDLIHKDSTSQPGELPQEQLCWCCSRVKTQNRPSCPACGTHYEDNSG